MDEKMRAAGWVTEDEYLDAERRHFEREQRLAAEQPRCSLCGAPATVAMPQRSVFPRSAACERCAGAPIAAERGDLWGEFYSYPLGSQLPLRPV